MPELTLLFVKFVTALSVETKELIWPMDMNWRWGMSVGVVVCRAEGNKGGEMGQL